jgi:hypothetical protein
MRPWQRVPLALNGTTVRGRGAVTFQDTAGRGLFTLTRSARLSFSEYSREQPLCPALNANEKHFDMFAPLLKLGATSALPPNVGVIW